MSNELTNAWLREVERKVDDLTRDVDALKELRPGFVVSHEPLPEERAELAFLRSEVGRLRSELSSARWDAKHEDETRRKILRDLLDIVANYTKDGDDALIGEGER